ncbi:MAG: hypothetical protein ACYDD6_11755 [Acidimicrobiales bacterium]
MTLLALVGVLLIAAVLVAVSMSLFTRRHGEAARPEDGWAPTDEVFRDPVTERTMRVWADRSGNRHYLPERPGPQDVQR